MNHNPDMNDLDTWLTWWNARALIHMQQHRAHRASEFNKVIDPESGLTPEEKSAAWEQLNDRHNVTLFWGERSAVVNPLAKESHPERTAPESRPEYTAPAPIEDFGGLVDQKMINSMAKLIKS